MRGGAIGKGGQMGLGQALGELSESRRRGGRRSQTGQDARQDFASRLAGERERDNGGRLGTDGEQGEIAAAERESFAGAGGGG